MFYVIPSAVSIFAAVFSFQWVGAFWRALPDLLEILAYGGIWIILSFILFGISATLFLGMPMALCWMYVRGGSRYWQQFSQRYGRGNAIAGVATVTAVGAIACLLLQHQPSAKAFELLATAPQTDLERQELLAEADTIRRGLQNAYLSRYRYLSSRADNNHIFALYRRQLGLPESVCLGIQRFYNQLMSPFLYAGSRSDVQTAETLYSEFFDTSIQKGEREAIRHALQATFNREEAKAGLINIDSQLVLLDRQEISVDERGDWAEIELHEVYRNQTFQDEEIFYSFALPESAVLTGLWLGNSSDLTERFEFRISPRGAAQQVYQQEVTRQVDPALLEQVGPRQYRLRAFPIPAKQVFQTPREMLDGDRQPELHLWMTYKVMQEERGWPLPRLLEHRNVFWTGKTGRFRNGAATAVEDVWVEDYLPATTEFNPQAHQVNLENYRVSATPFEGDFQADLSTTEGGSSEGLRLAILLDRSYSMEDWKPDVVQLFDWLNAHSFSDSDGGNNDADLYLFDSVSGTKRVTELDKFDASQIVNFGTIQPATLLNGFLQKKGEIAYDAVVLVTDAGSYELATDLPIEEGIAAPIWMLHMGEELPASYDDPLLEAIQASRGGVATDISQLLARLTTIASYPTATAVADGYVWQLETGVELDAEEESDSGFEAIAARQLILVLSRKEGTSQLEQLDRLHAIAKTHEVVSPYSSAIVLVNERQEQDLDEAEAASDRFDREVESGVEDLSDPFDPMTVSGVPEPEEWMLLGIVAIAVVVLGWRRWQRGWQSPA